MQTLAQRLSGHLLRSRIVLYGVGLPIIGSIGIFAAAGATLRIIYVLLGFSLIIFFHELGHFLVARMCSVKCLAFSLGIGPRAFGWRKGAGISFGPDKWDPDYKSKKKSQKTAERVESATVHSDLPTSADEPPHSRQIGDCDYRISYLPLGGYVRMLGQDDMDPTKVSRDPHAFNMRPIWQRMCIVSAGVIMNIIFAAVAFSIIFKVGVDFPTADIGFVHYGKPAYGKLQMGDHIVSIDGKKPIGFVEFTDLVIASALSSGNDEITFDFERPGEPGVKTVKIKPVRENTHEFYSIGVEQLPSLNIVSSPEIIDKYIEARAKSESELGMNDPKGAEEMKKLYPGAQIVSVNGEPLKHYWDLYQKIQQVGAMPVTLAIHDPKGKHSDTNVVLVPRLERTLGVPNFPDLFGLGARIKILDIEKRSPAAKAGFKSGDKIVSVGGSLQWPSEEKFRKKINESIGTTLDIVVLRDGKEVTLKAQPENRNGVGILGVVPASALDDLTVSPPSGSAPVAAVVGPTDRVKIQKVDGQPVSNWYDVYGVVKTKRPGDKISFEFASLDEETKDAAPKIAELTMDETTAKQLKEMTHYMLNLPMNSTTKTQIASTYSDATMMGLEHTKKFIWQVYMTLAGLMHGTVSPDNLHGMLGISYVGYHIQERGMAWFWYLMAMVSVNLAVANFLPLPIVDGGLFLLLILEKIRGKPLSLKIQSAIQVVGIVLLAGMFLFVTWNDLNLFK